MRGRQYIIAMSIFFVFLFSLGLLKSPAIAVETDIPDDAHSAATSLSFRVPQVSTFSGSVQHDISINVPPGRMNIQPNLNLHYSQSHHGGWLGVGWKLTIGAIRRSTKSSIDYSLNDYIHESESDDIELVLDTGNHYRARIEGAFARYFYNGTAGWMLVDRDGVKSYFGTTPASRIESGSRIFKWALDRIEDTNGNVVAVTYQKISGQLYPLHIDYDANNSIEFVWQERSDPITDLKPGWPIITSQLLEEIKTYGNAQAASVYKFTYEQNPKSGQSRLASYRRYSADEASWLPAQTFTYANGGNGSFDTNQFFLRTMSGEKNGIEDINGDGLADLIALDYTLDSYTGKFEEILLSVKINNGDGTFQSSYNTSLSCTGQSIQRVDFAQLNGDGLIDIHLIIKNFTSHDDWLYTKGFLNNGDGTFSAGAGALPRDTYSDDSIYSFGGDFNGDGLTDCYYQLIDTYNNLYLLKVRLNNGDGSYADAQTVGSDIRTAVSVADVNGDNLADFHCGTLIPFDPDKVLFSNGDGTFRQIDNFSFNDLLRRKTDINGDGLVDAVLSRMFGDSITISGVKIHTYLGESDGSLFSPVTTTVPCEGEYNKGISVKFVELNGDGIRDVVIITHSTYGERFYGFLGIGETVPNLLAAVANGYGAQTTFSYDYLRPEQKEFLPFSLTCVASIQTADGVGPVSDKRYENYSGALYNAENREFRGFESLTIKDLNTDDSTYRVTEEKFHQDGFRKGRLYERTLKDQEDGNVLLKTLWDWQEIDESASWGFVKLNRKRTEYENDSTLYSQSTYDYDGTNGLVQDVVKTGNDAEAITEHFEYDDYAESSDEQIWRKTEELVSGATSGTVRRSLYSYESGTGNLLQHEQVCVGDAASDCTGGYIHKYAYDDFGNLEYQWDPKTHDTSPPTITYIYDSATTTYPQRIINSLGHEIEQQWDPRFGKLVWQEDQNDQRTTYTYDGLGRLTHVGRPDGGETIHTYQDSVLPAYMRTQIKQAAGVYIPNWKYIDGLGRTVQTVTTGGPDSGGATRYVVSKMHYDAFGRVEFSAGPFYRTGSDFLAWSPGEQAYPISNFSYMATTYDKRNRPVQQSSRDGQNGLASNTLSYSGFAATITDPDDCSKTEVTDHLGRIIQVTDHADSGDINTYYEYNAAGELLQVKNHLWNSNDPNSNRTLMSYNTLGRKISMDDPDMGRWDYQYDANGNLILQADAKGQRIRFGYDALDRVVLKDYLDTAEPSVVYTYDQAFNGIGLPYGTTNSDVTTYYDAYDELGRVTDVRKSITGTGTRSSSYDYNFAGQVTHLTYPHTDASPIFYVNYAYHAGTSLLNTVTGSDGTTYAQLSDYMPTGKIGCIDFGNNAHTDYAYDGWSQRLTAINSQNAALQEIQNRTYTYSPAGDITVIDDLAWVETYYYSYDKLHRLTSEVTSTGSVGVTPGILELNYDDADHLHAASSVIRNGVTHPYTYDANGNQQSGPDMTDPLAAVTRTLTFNADNMPTQIIHPSGGTINLTYDGDSVRARKSGPNGTTYYFSDTFELINNVETCYIFAGNLRVAMVRDHQTTTYFHKDHLGSSTAMTDAGGNALEVTRYMPFGGKRGGGTGVASTAYGFTDQELDAESRLFNYDARLYDPIMGRFISADSIIPEVYNSQYLNHYTYCRNNPVKYIDPTGHYDDQDNYGDTELFGHEGTVYGSDDGRDNTDYGNTDHGGFDYYNQQAVKAYVYRERLLRQNGGAELTGWDAFKTDFYDSWCAASWAWEKIGKYAILVPLFKKLVRSPKTTAPKVGDKLTRHWGGKSGPNGESWTRDPLPQHTRDSLGLGRSNTGEYITQGRLKDTTGVTTRRAQPWDGFKGGGDEVLVPNPAKQIEVESVTMPDKPLPDF